MAQAVGPQPVAAQPGQALQSTIALIDTSLSEIRVLRDAIVRGHSKINAAISGEVEISEGYWKGLMERNLENHAKSLPSTSVSFPQLERLSRFLNEAHLDRNVKDLYEGALEASTWLETSTQFVHYYVTMFRRSVSSQRRSLIVERPLTYTSNMSGKPLQQLFDQVFPQAVAEFSNKKFVLNYRYLEKSTLNAVIELKYGRYAEKIFACHQKMLIVVNNGTVESLLIIAPHEDWTYLDEGRKTVDILKESRYVVYQKLTVQAHIHLMQTIHNIMDNQLLTSRTLSYVLTLLSKFHETINLKCKVCNRTMKNCLSPTIFDIVRSPNPQALHESCR
ncbi:unnamed protein product [Enterobius vermicularis]|uniref:Cullin domain-containing protein n=1 Tax=Enterobius vermicularis TaxID=51028 RepID=A0A0N4VIP3_ENTVE|nr:unnamed protein product [Enterobius vermicularis]